MDLRPAWQTDELAEEWVDPPSPISSPEYHPHDPYHATPPPVQPTLGSIKWIGTTTKKQRELSVSSAYDNVGTGRGMEMRVVSGDVENSLGSLIAMTSPSTLDSPPSSNEHSKRSSSSSSSLLFPSPVSKQQQQQQPTSKNNVGISIRTESPPSPSSVGLGTFIVKTTEQSDASQQQAIGLGKALRNPFIGSTGDVAGGGGGGGGGLFAKSRLESMFDPPPSSSLSSGRERVEETTPDDRQPRQQQPTTRKQSHSYVPSKPSRLSESVTPPSRTSSASSSMEMGIEIENKNENQNPSSSLPTSNCNSDSGVDGTPTPNHRRNNNNNNNNGDNNKIRHFSGSKVDPNGQTTSSPFDNVEFSFSPNRIQIPNHSPSSQQHHHPITSTPPALKLFQRTYDTYTREHLSAIVDSISAQGTPVKRGGKMKRKGSSFGSASRSASASGAGSGSSSGSGRSGRASSEGTVSSNRSRRSWIERDTVSPIRQSPSDGTDSDEYRASKRIRLSASPRSDSSSRSRSTTTEEEEVEVDAMERRQGSGRDRRSWGERGEEVLRRIKERKWGSPESSWAGSRRDESTAPSSSPSIQSIPPTPPLRSTPLLVVPARIEPGLGVYGSYRSTLSGTGSGSSGTITEQYISAGRNIMDKIKLRNVSDSSATTGSESRKEGTKQAGRNGQVSERTTSPRKMLKTLSEVDEVSRVENAEAGPSRLRPGSAMSESIADSSTTVKAAVRQPASAGGGGPQVRIAAPFGQQRPATIPPEDLNRYVSSASTANTNITAVSTSFIKHRGTAPPPPSHGRKFKDVITFESVQKQLPDVVGRMVFDKQQMKWVKAPSSGGDVTLKDDRASTASDRSVDVFAGLESLKEDVEPTPTPPRGQSAMEYSQSPQSFTSERSDAGTGHSGEAARTDAATVDDFSQLSVQDEGDIGTEPPAVIKPSFDRSFQFPHAQRPGLLATGDDATPATEAGQVNATPNPARVQDKAPTSALKKRLQAIDPATPVNNSSGKESFLDSVDRRSVSFSDGRKSGKMLDVRVLVEQSKKRRAWNDLARPVSAASSCEVFESESIEAGSAGVSMRTTRIREMVDLLDETVDESVPSPSKRTASINSRSLARSESDQSAETNEEVGDSEPSRGGLSRYTYAKLHPGNATFLTECSFAVAHDKLVELITEVQPFEPHWEVLTTIDLSGRGADSVARLKEFLPALDEAILNDNAISYLSGIPSTIRTLQVAGNRLTSLTAVNHLQHLQYLDISRNQVESVNALNCLRHLRELRMDDNKISDISDIMDMDCLIKLSCSRNAIEQIDLTKAKWAKMEALDLSSNRIKRLEGVDRLQSLNTLNLECNHLESLSVTRPMQQLRSLRVSHNELYQLDISGMPRLRTLYADNNAISCLERSTGPLSSRLENISLRNQRVDRLSLTYEDLREVKRLYISGNPLPHDFFPSRPLFSLVYIEAAACKLSEWPANLARRVPNLRCLNLNYNFLRDLDGLQGLTALRKLMMVGGRLGANGTKLVLRGLRGLEGLQEVDLRMNPCNLNYYLPLLLSGGTAGTTSSLSWLQLDDNFRRSLPDEWYSKRLIYRGMVMMACDGIVQVDGIAVSEAEREKARQLIEGGTRDR